MDTMKNRTRANGTRRGILFVASPGVALQLAQLDDQRAVIEAIGGAAKQAAQYALDYNNALKDHSPADAQLIAAEKLANAQAAAVASARQGTQSLQDQNNLQQAGFVSTYNGATKLSDLQLAVQQAAAVGDQQRIASEQAYSKVLKDTGDTKEALNRADAVALSYADKLKAAQDKVKDATEANYQALLLWQQGMLGLSTEAQALTQASQDAAQAWENAQRAAQDAQFSDSGGPNSAFGSFTPVAETGSQTNGVGTGNSFTSTSELGFQIQNAYNFQKALAAAGGTPDNSLPALSNILQSSTTPNFSDFGLANLAPPSNSQIIDKSLAAGGISAGITTAEKLLDVSTAGTLVGLQNSQTTDKGAQLTNDQQFLAWLQTQPTTLANLQAIATLTSSMQSLTGATNANTAATLNPLYSQGHGALAIGYYHAASGLDMVASGPTSGDQVPFHAMVNGGERIQIGPATVAANNNSASVRPTTTIVQNFDFRGAKSNSRRSSRQYAQGFGQTAAALS
jgi:hypothetical protein